MLFVICDNDIYRGDEIQCVLFIHFICADLREANFRKMNKQTKLNWSCTSCQFGKNKNDTLDKTNRLLSLNGNKITIETLNGVIKSVQFMSSQFDNFGQQLKAEKRSVKFIISRKYS